MKELNENVEGVIKEWLAARGSPLLLKEVGLEGEVGVALVSSNKSFRTTSEKCFSRSLVW
jgi:hypothetical protein